MTICLAAIGKENGKEFIVFATDHMVSTNFGQFEHSIVKYQKINGSTVAMLAGDPLLFDDLIKINDDTDTYCKIKNIVLDNFKKKREEIIKNEIFDLFGIDKNYFLEILKMPDLNPALESMIKNAATTQLNTGILLIGFENKRAQITEINELGFKDYRVVNFHAIGSGNTQAMNALLFQRHGKNDNLRTTIYNVYKAKRNAEVLVGVGKETDLLVLTQNCCTKIDDELMKTLKNIYKEEQLTGKNHKDLNKLDVHNICNGEEECTVHA